eukprot:3442908-Rhodomonas_salina.1
MRGTEVAYGATRRCSLGSGSLARTTPLSPYAYPPTDNPPRISPGGYPPTPDPYTPTPLHPYTPTPITLQLQPYGSRATALLQPCYGVPGPEE